MVNKEVKLTIVARVKNLAGKQLKKIEKDLRKVEKQTKETRGKMMSLGFSMLFAGMAMKKAAENALRGIFAVFKAAEDNTNPLLQGIHRLNAAITFFKFSLVDAVSNSDLFLGMLEKIIGMVDWFNRLDETVKSGLVGFLLFALVLGSIISPLGQIALISMAITASFGITLGIIGVVAAAVFFLWTLWSEGGGKAVKVIKYIITVLVLLLVFIAIVSGGWVLLIVAAVMAMIIAVWLFRDRIVEAMKSAVDWIRQKWEGFVNWLIDKLNKVISLMNKIPGVNIPMVSPVGNNEIPKFQEGGFVPRTGPAILHAGEFVLSKKMITEKSSGGGGVTVGDINVSVLGETSDADRLAEIVSERVLAEFERYAHRGGI